MLIALLHMLRSVAIACVDDAQRAEVRRAAALVTAEMSDTIAEHDRDGVSDMARRVEFALAGDLGAAFDDRAGETRSM